MHCDLFLIFAKGGYKDGDGGEINIRRKMENYCRGRWNKD
jgi:hypothetical protein